MVSLFLGANVVVAAFRLVVCGIVGFVGSDWIGRCSRYFLSILFLLILFSNSFLIFIYLF